MGLSFTNLLELEMLARDKIAHSAFEYILGGAEDEVSLRRNREAFGRWALRPRVLVDVSTCDTSTTILGERVSLPVLVAPTAFHGLVHPEGELATAKGAADAGTIMVVSTLATRSPEEIATVGRAPRWFQLYVMSDRQVTEALVRRVVRAGYTAMCLTVDAPVVGHRERDVRNAFAIPEDVPTPNIPRRKRETAFDDDFATWVDPSLTWKDLAWLRSICPLPLVLKGVMTAEDATLAVEHGVQGIVVSNHGGRQLDGTLGTLDVLPEVVEAVKGRAEVYVDGGIRRGTDVVTALALGANAVLLGRPILYALALAGAEGVRAVLDHIRSELEAAMALIGAPTIAAIRRDHVQPAPPSARGDPAKMIPDRPGG